MNHSTQLKPKMKRRKREPHEYPHEWVFKLEWRSTAMKVKIAGMNLKQAELRAWGTVSRLEGGGDCLSVRVVEQLR